MDGYINQQDAVDDIMGEPSELHYPVYYAEKIRSLPTADVRRVSYGAWKWHNTLFGVAWYECNKCGYQIEAKAFKAEYENFCSNCGADMRWRD